MQNLVLGGALESVQYDGFNQSVKLIPILTHPVVGFFQRRDGTN